MSDLSLKAMARSKSPKLGSFIVEIYTRNFIHGFWVVFPFVR